MKLVKNKIVDSYGDSSIQWVISEEIKNIDEGSYLEKGSYSWECYSVDNKRIDIGFASNKKDAIEKVYAYSLMIDELKAEELRLQAEEDKKREIARQFAEFKKNELALGDDRFFMVGQFIEVEMSGMSKHNNIVDYFESVYLYGGVQKHNGKIEQVIELSNDEYDEFVESFWDGDVVDKLKPLLGDKGGNHSDNPMLEGLSFDEVFGNESFKRIWHESSYELLSAVVSKGKKAIMINSQGHDYARYIAFAV